MNRPYDDIITMKHPTPRKHPRMSRLNRAAQFAPFAALTGYDAAVREAARLTESKAELDEGEKERLDRKLRFLADHLEERLRVVITYFKADKRKTGGAYVAAAGVIKKIDNFRRKITLMEGEEIYIDDIYEIQSKAFCWITE